MTHEHDDHSKPAFTAEQQQAMYELVKQARAATKYSAEGLAILELAATLLVTDIESAQPVAPERTETGGYKQYFIRCYQKYVSSIFYEDGDGKIIWVEDPDTYENAKKRVRELNVQAAVDRIPPSNTQAAAHDGDRETEEA